MSKIISLREQKIKKFHDYLDKKIQGAKEKFSFINSQLPRPQGYEACN